MPKNAHQLWVTHELIPFLQAVFRYRVSRPGTGGRLWDNAWSTIVQSATRYVSTADVQHYSPTPFFVVERLYRSLVDPKSSTHPVWASMSIESCAIVFVKHAKTYGPYLLFSRRYVQPASSYVRNVWLEALSEQQNRQESDDDSLYKDREREALHRLFHQGRWMETVDPRAAITTFDLETPERARESYDAFESGHLMFGGRYESQDLAVDVPHSAAMFSTVADRDPELCDSFGASIGSNNTLRRSSV